MAANDATLTESERTERAERYAARVIEILNRLSEQDFFSTAEHLRFLKEDSDLDAVRDREDFKALLRKVLNGNQ